VALPPVNAEICPPSNPPSGKLRRIVSLGFVLAIAAAGLTVLMPATAAHAAPTISQQITDLNNQIETVVEQYNGITTKLAADQKKSAQLGNALAPAQLESALAQQRVSAVVRDLYIAGPGSGLVALMDAPSMTDMADQLGMLTAIGQRQRATVTNANVLVRKYQTQKKALDVLIKQEAAQKAQLAAKKKDILAKLAHLRTLQAAQAAAAKAAAAKAAAAKAAAAKAAASGRSNGGGCSGTSTSSKTSECYVMPVACPQVSSGGAGFTAAKKACSLVWPIHWYGWAEAGPTEYDCSGLTMVAWKAAGVTLQHYTGSQWDESHAISKSDLRVGDLVFYNSGHHVAIYIGNGWIVQAEETGEPLKESPMTFAQVVSDGYRRVNGT
jgi:cell wall-associated NlpC family hydrolase